MKQRKTIIVDSIKLFLRHCSIRRGGITFNFFYTHAHPDKKLNICRKIKKLVE